MSHDPTLYSHVRIDYLLHFSCCFLVPFVGFIDVYNEDKQAVGQHGTRILNVSFQIFVGLQIFSL